MGHALFLAFCSTRLLDQLLLDVFGYLVRARTRAVADGFNLSLVEVDLVALNQHCMREIAQVDFVDDNG